MSAHLTSKDISRCLVEGLPDEWEEHMHECAGCQAKLREAKEPLNDFRSALVAWSEAEPIPTLTIAPQPSRSPQWAALLNWSPVLGLAVTMVLLAGVLASPTLFNRHLAPDQTASLPVISDTVLMDQVDEEVSEAVPDAMAPLTDLVSWDTDQNTTATVAQKKEARKVHAKNPAKAAAGISQPVQVD